jgi:putative Holliday junction resolvase
VTKQPAGEPVQGRYLGIDVGVKRVGLATADPEARVAHAWQTIEPARLVEVIKTQGPFAEIVVGLPRNLAGTDTAQTLAVRRFCDDTLGAQLGIDPVFQDEAATSSVAEAELRASGRSYTKADIDAQAAAIILQDYLDTL